MVMLTRCNPTTDMTNHRMGRLFDEMLGNGFRRTAEERSLRGAWVPAINILEQDEAVLITADLPGLKPEDVEVTVDEGTLTIRGERQLEEATEGETYHRVEGSYGSFERSFSIPESVEAKKIEARFANGEMTVTMPKRAESKPRSVKVKVATA